MIQRRRERKKERGGAAGPEPVVGACVCVKKKEDGRDQSGVSKKAFTVCFRCVNLGLGQLIKRNTSLATSKGLLLSFHHINS